MSSAKAEIDGSPRGGARGPTGLDPATKDSSSMTAGHSILRSLDVWDITGFPGEDLLSETVRVLLLLN